MKLLETIFSILMLPFFLIAGLIDFIKEYWWAVLILVMLLWPKIADRVERESEVQAAAIQETEAQTDATRAAFNIGVCKTLAKNAHVMVLFLDDAESGWDEEAITEYLQEAVDPALTYLENEAAEYGITLDLDYSYYVDETGKPCSVAYLGTVTDGADINDDIMEQSAAALGFTSKFEMLEQDRIDSGEEQIAYLVCTNKNARSFAVISSGEGMEYMMLFNQIPDKWSRKNGVAHEMLHLFGAEDMYAENGKNINREKLAKKLHRYDVMLEARWDISKNTVGPFTAYCIGWLDELPEEYNCPEWWS